MYLRHSGYDHVFRKNKINPRIYDGYVTVDHLIKIGKVDERYSHSFIKLKIMHQILADLTGNNKYINKYNKYEDGLISGIPRTPRMLKIIPFKCIVLFNGEICVYSPEEFNIVTIKLLLDLVKNKVDVWKHDINKADK